MSHAKVLLLDLGIVVAILVVAAILAPKAQATELQGGGFWPGDKTIFGCNYPVYAEILVGYHFTKENGDRAQWMRYCVFAYTNPEGVSQIYARSYEVFWEADMRCASRISQSFQPGEVVLLKDETAYAYYKTGSWYEETYTVIQGPGFFMRAKAYGFATGNACINPPLSELKKVGYLTHDELPPPADFVLGTDTRWLDMGKAIKRLGCKKLPWWSSSLETSVLYPECLGPNLNNRTTKILGTPIWPFAPIPPRPRGDILIASEVSQWCVAGYCSEFRFTGRPERNENGVITGSVVQVTYGTGIVLSLPPGVWAKYSPGRDQDGNKMWWTAFGPQTIYAEEAFISPN